MRALFGMEFNHQMLELFLITKNKYFHCNIIYDGIAWCCCPSCYHWLLAIINTAVRTTDWVSGRVIVVLDKLGCLLSLQMATLLLIVASYLLLWQHNIYHLSSFFSSNALACLRFFWRPCSQFSLAQYGSNRIHFPHHILFFPLIDIHKNFPGIQR